MERQGFTAVTLGVLNLNLKAVGEQEMPERSGSLAGLTSDPVSPLLIYAPQGEKTPNASSLAS